jgi:hypothetical protein
MEIEMTDREFAVYGMSQQDIRNQYMDSLTARFSGQEMVVMSILSDCQEMLASTHSTYNREDDVRKQLNIAKFILSEMMDEKRSR